MRTARIAAPALLLFARALSAAVGPVPVSPGEGAGSALIGNTCPTFSWSALDGAEAYELVVYRLDEDGREPVLVLQESVIGGSSAWTPALDRCLERGRRYAWSIRATGEARATEWSAPALFEVSREITGLELESALAVVNRYLEQQEGEYGRDETGGKVTAPIPRDGSVSVGEVRKPLRSPARSHLGEGGSIRVDGALVETKADPPCYPSDDDEQALDRFVNCGNGTVLDTATGLLWLEWANCRSCFPPVVPCPVEDGARNWHESVGLAAILSDGHCGLSDQSQPGDWRLASINDFLTISDPGCGQTPRLTGRDGGCYSEPGNAWALEVAISLYWTSSTVMDDGSEAHWFSTETGGSGDFNKQGLHNYFWAVREGQ